VWLALPHAPQDDLTVAQIMAGVGQARRAAALVAAGLRTGTREREGLLAAMRELGPFDEHGDPVDPPVWLWRVGQDWALVPDRAL
jgi:hypothetical protein